MKKAYLPFPLTPPARVRGRIDEEERGIDWLTANVQIQQIKGKINYMLLAHTHAYDHDREVYTWPSLMWR